MCGAENLFAKNTGSLKEVAKIIVYFAGVVLLGALLAPPLYWAGQALAAHGVMRFLAEVEFQKFFNRAMLIAALVLLWPMIRWLRISGLRDLGLEPDRRAGAHFFLGFSIAALFVAAMAASYVAFGVYRWRGELPWSKLPGLAVSALVVGLLEEALFRGAIFGLFRRALSPFAALFWVTAIFAIVHFLKPDDQITVTSVQWHSGLALVPHVFHQFAEPMKLLAEFSTLFVFGWTLGYATLRTRALWMSMGFHAGVVFVKMGFSKFTRREAAHLPWIGPELQIGLVPVAVLALGGVFVWWWLRHEDSASRR